MGACRAGHCDLVEGPLCPHLVLVALGRLRGAVMLASWVGPLGKARGRAREGFLSWAGESRGVTMGAASLAARSSGGGGTPVGQGHKEAPWTCRTHQMRSHSRKAYLCFVGFPGGSDSKASAYNVGDLGSIPGLGRSPGEGNGNPLQYSCRENPMDGGA